MASFVYDSLLSDALAGNVQASDSFYAMLVGAGYAADQAHSRRSSVTNEVVGVGYTAGGKPVVPTISKNTSTHRTTITFPPVSWPNSTLTAKRIVYYKRRGGAPSSDELVAQSEFTESSSASTTFAVGETVVEFNTPVAI